MNLEQFDYVIEVAKRGTISEAAENLHVSNSAISQAITNLESELGISIFKRSRHGSTCTDDGKLVLQFSHDIMNKIMEMKETFQKIKTSFSVSSSPIFFTTMLPSAIKTFKKDFPQVQLEINENNNDSIIDSIKAHKFDLGLIFGSEQTLISVSSYLQAKSLYEPKLMVAVSKHSPLANNITISPEEVIQHPLIIRNEKFAKDLWNDVFVKYGEGQVLFYSNNDEVIKNVIANGLAIGILTDLMRNDQFVLSGDIILIPYEDKANQSTLHLISIQAKNKYSSIVEKHFLNCIKNKINLY